MPQRQHSRANVVSKSVSRWAAVLGVWVLLAGCGGGGGGAPVEPPGGSSPPPKVPLATSAARLFPLDADGVAVYAGAPGTDALVMHVGGTQPLADQQTATLLRWRSATGAVEGLRAFVVSEAGVRQYAAAGSDAISRAFDGSYVMRLPAYAGDSHVQVDTTLDSGVDYDGDGRFDRVSLHAEVVVVGAETITVPAGMFSNALRQRQVFKQTVHPSSGKADQQLITTTETWYASGVGVVRQVQTAQGPDASGTTTRELAKYRFGGQTNDSDSPVLLSLQPALGVQAAVTSQVVATFSEEMGEDSFTAQTFVVTGPDGRAVAGTLGVAGRVVTFTPAQVLAGGAYRVDIGAAVADLFGRRAMAAVSHNFAVDAVGPQVVSTWPAAGARNVGLTSTISIGFSEAPAGASVNASTVRLTRDGVAVQATARVSAMGILIEPPDGLQRGSRYEVAVSGVTDGAGNVMVKDLRFSFDTTPGRFAGPERFIAEANGSIGAHAVAAGDINSDGFADIAYADEGDEGYPDAVYARLGRAGGQLAPPARLNLSTYFQPDSTRRCPITALAIGDVTGDGRADLAVGSWMCGVLVLQQNSAGVLEPAQFINELVHVLRVADINGDGRLDLVGVQNFWNKSFIWIQGADARLSLAQTPTLGDVAGRDVAIGDVNGDGRLDLIVALRAQDAVTANIAVQLQDASGQFSAPRYLSAGTLNGIWGVAVGDFNGDGRLDIAGTTIANTPASLHIFLQSADGSFAAPMSLPTLDGAYAVLTGDIDGDGRADLVVQHEGWSQVGIYRQSASGTMAPEELYEAPGRSISVQSLALADINQDGLLDVVGAASLLRQVPLAVRSPLGRHFGKSGAGLNF